MDSLNGELLDQVMNVWQPEDTEVPTHDFVDHCNHVDRHMAHILHRHT